jgi:hypothetical protein
MMPCSLGNTYCTYVLKELDVFVFHFSALKVGATGFSEILMSILETTCNIIPKELYLVLYLLIVTF